jgi:hypothetical protein
MPSRTQDDLFHEFSPPEDLCCEMAPYDKR